MSVSSRRPSRWMAGSRHGSVRLRRDRIRRSWSFSHGSEACCSRRSTPSSPRRTAGLAVRCLVMDATVPARVREYADQAVEYVRRALGVALEYDSDTLPLLDHYLRNVPESQPATIQLVIAT